METKEIESLLKKAFDGDASAQGEVRKQFTDMNNFLAESGSILKRMAVNDYSLKVEGNYTGLTGEIASDVNLVRERVMHVAESIENIGNGDMSEYEVYKKIGRRSEKDVLVPGFIKAFGAIGLLINDAKMLINAAVDGKLDARADATQHEGDYRKIIEGVNTILDSVIGPLNITAEYVERISKGDVPQKITEKYNGDFNEIKNNLNILIDVVNMRNADINMLINATVEGKLDARADVTKYSGANGKMVTGINNMLDSVIGPLNITAEYVERISKGDVPQKITEKYNGDFNEIKNNLNILIDVVNMRNGDIAMLTQAAAEGRLATRADIGKYQGANGKMIAGINNMLDVMVNPINEAIRISHEYSECKFKTRVNEELHFKGDFLKLKNALNEIGTCVSNTSEMINTQAKAYANCNFTARIDDSVKVHGDFVAIKDSLNHIGISVSEAVGVINVQTSDLSASAEEALASLSEVSTASVQISDNAQKVNENAEKSAQGIDQVLQAMVDMNAAVQQVTTSMEAVSNEAKLATDASKSGAILAENVEKGMSEISRSTDSVNSTVKDIEKQMADISKIVVLIRDLANQTNLLALNAAIEAARAGDAGRGFAVVATEVKSLAQESRGSAEKIEEMITNLNKSTKNAAIATEEAKGLVVKGAQMSSEALDAFNKIKEAAENVANKAAEVAAATEEQAATVEEITASVHEVQAQVEGTSKEASNAAAAAEQATASINEVNKVVENVNKVVENVSHEMAKFTV